MSTLLSEAEHTGIALWPDTFQHDGVLDHEAVLNIDTELYGIDALFQACYAFTDRCYFHLSAMKDGKEVSVYLRRKNSDGEIADVAGEFANELVNQRVRLDLFRRTHALREIIVAQAFTEADLIERAEGKNEF
jgi:His-Xaa-Ser system protein HxsD